MNPNVEKKKVRPYLSKGFRIGTDLALWFTGLTAGAFHKRLNCIVKGALCLLRVRVIGSEKTTSYSKGRIGISPFSRKRSDWFLLCFTRISRAEPENSWVSSSFYILVSQYVLKMIDS